jgi:hypothetical protein
MMYLLVFPIPAIPKPVDGIFREKPSIPEYTGFEIGKTGIIPVSVLTF